MDTLYRIKQLLEQHKATQKELCDYLGLGKNTFSDWLGGRSKSYLKLLPQIAEYFGVSVDYLLGKTDTKKEPANILPVGELIKMPVIASVRAGYGGTAVEEVEADWEAVPLSMLRGYAPEECRLLRVKGNSMWPRILDGDLVLVHLQSSVDSGDIAIVIYDSDEATIKRVRYVNGEDWLELIPSNPEYPTKRIEGRDVEDCHVYGKVIALWCVL